jgi:hypothetical protein
MRSRLVEVYAQERSGGADCSIVVPIYNGARFLRRSIPAVLGQADIVCDILISDDCSEDGSLDVVLRLVKAYSGPHGVRVFRTSEPAVCEHMPLLVAESRSSRIIQAHQDDVSDPKRARALASTLSGKVKLVTSASRIRSGRHVREPTAQTLAFLRNNANFPTLLANGWGLIRGAAYGMHRDIFERFPPLSWDYLSHGHDMLLYVRAHVLGRCRIIFSPLLTIGDHPDRGYYQLVDRQDSATTAFDAALRILAVLRTARSELDLAWEAGLVEQARKTVIEAQLDETRRYALEKLVTNRELAIRRGFRLSWTRRAGRLG